MAQVPSASATIDRLIGSVVLLSPLVSAVSRALTRGASDPAISTAVITAGSCAPMSRLRDADLAGLVPTVGSAQMNSEIIPPKTYSLMNV